jgi:hypothetical protein
VDSTIRWLTPSHTKGSEAGLCSHGPWVNIKGSAMKKIVLIAAALLAVASVTTGCIGKGKGPVPVETNG